MQKLWTSSAITRRSEVVWPPQVVRSDRARDLQHQDAARVEREDGRPALLLTPDKIKRPPRWPFSLGRRLRLRVPSLQVGVAVRCVDAPWPRVAHAGLALQSSTERCDPGVRCRRGISCISCRCHTDKDHYALAWSPSFPIYFSRAKSMFLAAYLTVSILTKSRPR